MPSIEQVVGTSPCPPRYYSQDGTWRTGEPSWRYLLGAKDNLRGCGSWAFPLHDPALPISSKACKLHKRHHRAQADNAPATPEVGDPTAPIAEATALAFFQISHKDQKRSGFANVTQCHSSPHEQDSARWGRLGMMTRERLMCTNQYGEIEVPRQRPSTAKPQVMRPARAEATGFTRGALVHHTEDLTGGHKYVPPQPPARPQSAAPVIPQTVGKLMPTGFALNNENLAAIKTPATAAQWMHSGIGYEGAVSMVDRFGDMHRRPLSAIEIARQAQGPIKALKVESSGFTRNKLAGTNLAEPVAPRPLSAPQTALRMMAKPVEHTDPHAHKRTVRPSRFAFS